KVENLQEYLDRIDVELKVMLPAMISDYFLILWDIINWSRKNNIMIGTGRGSVAGSLDAYVLDLHDTDPIKYNLLFERFLNETRIKPLETFELTLDNDKVIKVQKGIVVKLKNGKDVLVEDINEGDDIDEQQFIKINK